MLFVIPNSYQLITQTMVYLTRQFKIVNLAASCVIASGAVWALEGVSSNTTSEKFEINVSENDGVIMGFNHPQTLSVSSPNNEANRASGGVINRTWHIASNNAVKVDFSGKSPDSNGESTEVPNFHKAEVDAEGKQIGTQFDHLITTFGATINNMKPGQGTLTGEAIWAGGAVEKDDAKGSAGIPDRITNFDGTNGTDKLKGTPEDLIANAGESFGVIMPDDDGNFSMTLSTRGVGDASTTQSGDYQLTVVASFVASEVGNLTIIAKGAEKNSPDGGLGFLTDSQNHNDLAGKDATYADNSRWVADKSDDANYNLKSVLVAGADGGKTRRNISAQKISDVANDTTATNAAYYDENLLQ